MTQLGESVFSDSDSEPEEKPEEVKGVKIRFSVFFDGTLNNRANVEAREQETTAYRKHKSSGSYDNDKSNVARMEPYIDDAEGFDFTQSGYIEGIGTLDLEGDSGRGAALGTGATGVKAKVNIGLTKVVSKILKIQGLDYGDTIDELVFDVFGFSRGAAGARYFVHKALHDKVTGRGRNRVVPRPMARRLRAVGFVIENTNVKFNFVGLYDTVASEGINHSNDTRSLKLDAIARPDVETVVQLAAAAEHRANFSLTTIESAGGKGKEVFLPGVHSDIGGGYRDGRGEKLTLYKSYSRDEVEADRDNLIAIGWYREGEIRIDEPIEVPFNPGYGVPGVGYAQPLPQKFKLRVNRESISNHYSKIALHIMADFSRKAKINIKSRLERSEAVPSELSAVHRDLKAYAQGGGSKASDWFVNRKYSWLSDLHHDHLHFSSHYTTTAGIIAAMKPNLVNGKRTRKRHYG